MGEGDERTNLTGLAPTAIGLLIKSGGIVNKSINLEIFIGAPPFR